MHYRTEIQFRRITKKKAHVTCDAHTCVTHVPLSACRGCSEGRRLAAQGGGEWTRDGTALLQPCRCGSSRCPAAPAHTGARVGWHTSRKGQASQPAKKSLTSQNTLHSLAHTAEALLIIRSSMSTTQKLPPPPLTWQQNILAGAFAGMAELCCM